MAFIFWPFHRLIGVIAFTLADYPEHRAWITGLFAPICRPPQIVEEHDSMTSLIAAVESCTRSHQSPKLLRLKRSLT